MAADDSVHTVRKSELDLLREENEKLKWRMGQAIDLITDGAPSIAADTLRGWRDDEAFTDETKTLEK